MERVSKEYNLKSECVLSSDIDSFCRLSYEANFGEYPDGDITEIDEKNIPDHDILFAGFPCQPFSIIGQMRGFEDTRGTLFFDIARILKEKKPTAFVLENVKQLVGHNGGKTLKTILSSLKEIGYQTVMYSVLNALDYGLPQKRERIIIVGHLDPVLFSFPVPVRPVPALEGFLEKKVDQKYYASSRIVEKRKSMHQAMCYPSIWHENKSGNICSYPYSCALRAGASYNYLLVNGERRLTPREMFRLQGFPDSYQLIHPDGQLRKQAGNSVPVNMIASVIRKLLPFVAKTLNPTHTLQEYNFCYNRS